ELDGGEYRAAGIRRAPLQRQVALLIWWGKKPPSRSPFAPRLAGVPSDSEQVWSWRQGPARAFFAALGSFGLTWQGVHREDTRACARRRQRLRGPGHVDPGDRRRLGRGLEVRAGRRPQGRRRAGERGRGRREEGRRGNRQELPARRRHALVRPAD